MIDIKKTIEKIKKIRIESVILIILLGVALGVYYRYGNIAVVNGKGISRIEYYRMLDKQVGKQTLDRMITENLILQDAIKNNVKIEQGDIDGEIGKIEENLKSQNQTLDAALAAEGMSKLELENQIRIQKMVDVLSDPKKEAGEAEINEYLKTNKDQLPKGLSKTELNDLAKEQIESGLKSDALNEWLEKIRQEAKIIYR